MKAVQRLGILTGGGDCPGLNAVIRAVVRHAAACGLEVVGLEEGFFGLMKERWRPLPVGAVSSILTLGGTILGTTRVNPLRQPKGVVRIQETVRHLGLDGVVVVGGEGTMRIAQALQRSGIPIVGIPKTIDNDVFGTDYTVGFDTAVHVATEAIDRLHSTAEAQNRIMLVEVMGRHAGWIATHAGIAGGADAVLIPEFSFSMKKLLALIRQREARGRRYSIFVVAEDARIALDDRSPRRVLRTPVRKDEYGRLKVGGIAESLAGQLRRRIAHEVRVVVLGHVQRGGTPTAFDRILASRFGVAAVDLARRRRWGRMVALRGDEIVPLPLRQIAGRLKRVPRSRYEIAASFFG